jgi:hypothetical protein
LLNFISAAIKITLSAALPADNLLGKYALQTKGSAEGHRVLNSSLFIAVIGIIPQVAF